MATTIIDPPLRKRYVLVVDVETTGLIPKQSKTALHPLPITQYPYIIQFAFILYDMIDGRVVQMYDNYVRIPDLVPIPDIVTDLTGIYKLMCEIRGRPIIECLNAFTEAYKIADCVVAHNLEFDQEMILIEIERNRPEIIQWCPQVLAVFQPLHERVRNLEKYCTMKHGTNLCNIVALSQHGRPPRIKWPKLLELHQYLFGDEETIAGLHTAMVDVKTCLKCYLKMRHNYSMNPILG